MGSEPTRNVFACTWCCRSWRWVGAGCADTEVTASAVSCQELSCFHGVISCLWGRILFMKIASDVPFLAARTISLYPTYFCPCTDVRGTLRACLYSGSVLEGNNWYSTGLGTVWMPCCCVGSTYTWSPPPCCLLLMTNFSCGAMSKLLHSLVASRAACAVTVRATEGSWTSQYFEICEQGSGACSASAWGVLSVVI